MNRYVLIIRHQFDAGADLVAGLLAGVADLAVDEGLLFTIVM
jgi:hypothetical protein